MAPTVGSMQAVGDASNSFCIDPTHIAPLSQFFTDMANGTLPSFSYIEAGYGVNDEHPGSGQSIFTGQAQNCKHSRQVHEQPLLGGFSILPELRRRRAVLTIMCLRFQDTRTTKRILASIGHLPLGSIPDISTIAVNPDSFNPCLANGPADSSGNPTPTTHCDLSTIDPGAASTDAPAAHGFAAELGFRLPNMVISPFTRRHYVSHVPMDHTAIIKFVESRFIGGSAHLTNRDAAQPDLLDFFDFVNVPWRTPPAASSLPAPPAVGSTCTPTAMQ